MNRKDLIWLILIISLTITLVIVESIFVKSQKVPTELNISYSNNAPVLIKLIPNQTIVKNTNLPNSIKLDEYFTDNETLTYNATSVMNISIIIDQNTSYVSFYPDYEFEGIRTVIFTAFDGITSTNSNLVYINVTKDMEPPLWSNPSKDKADSQIFQNTLVSFSAEWTDNFALSYYIFSIKELGTWRNYSPVTFSGKKNISIYPVQIMSPGGSEIEWLFYAFDTSGNMNKTNIEKFLVAQQPSQPFTPPTRTETSKTQVQKEKKTRVFEKESLPDYLIEPNVKNFKLELKQGSSGTIAFKIINIGNTNISFEINVSNLSEIKRVINNNNFTLEHGESKTVTIEFTANKRTVPNLYYGMLEIKTSIYNKRIPIVIEVKPIESEIDIDIEIIDREKEFRPGDRVRANITISHLKDIEEMNLLLYYSIVDFTGNVLDSNSEELNFNKEIINFERNLSLPVYLEKGDYIFFVRAIEENKIVIDSEIFKVGERFNLLYFIQSNLLIILLIVLTITSSTIMIKRYRDRERLRLLNLYMMMTQLNKLVKEKKYDEAIEVYLNIKAIYKEPLELSLKNKELLKKEVEELSKKFEESEKKKIEEKISSVDKNKIEIGNEENKKESVNSFQKNSVQEAVNDKNQSNNQYKEEDKSKKLIEEENKKVEKKEEEKERDTSTNNKQENNLEKVNDETKDNSNIENKNENKDLNTEKIDKSNIRVRNNSKDNSGRKREIVNKKEKSSNSKIKKSDKKTSSSRKKVKIENKR
ncbi:MAG: hypothetical protein QXJ28_01555 [Candidatus Pacearchaeota archaeon]